MRFSKLYIEKDRGGANPHWVAIWEVTTTTGRQFWHDRLPFAASRVGALEAELYALEHEPAPK